MRLIKIETALNKHKRIHITPIRRGACTKCGALVEEQGPMCAEFWGNKKAFRSKPHIYKPYYKLAPTIVDDTETAHYICYITDSRLLCDKCLLATASPEPLDDFDSLQAVNNPRVREYIATYIREYLESMGADTKDIVNRNYGIEQATITDKKEIYYKNKYWKEIVDNDGY